MIHKLFIFLSAFSITGFAESSLKHSSSTNVVLDSPQSSVPEIKLVMSLWPEAKQRNLPHVNSEVYGYVIDVGMPQANEQELMNEYIRGLADLGWKPIEPGKPNTKYKNGNTTLQVIFDSGRHPTTLLLRHKREEEGK